ncbi:hypothetical protein BD324DRAFT_638889 [Kockovaella imperatae]|uniref:rRNA-processing protein FYV7 n=1 Tax=Kockovaella imperatae TaxID=4999 RepID=A0A1Y1U9U8_9TREE|nr:hypothetical protein BD324DRAFT_638889 [Kockovaella imperatae]ORX33855.1 hypothetical protein BD324DRAFT_638889 [Kockovaella imperatae]
MARGSDPFFSTAGEAGPSRRSSHIQRAQRERPPGRTERVGARSATPAYSSRGRNRKGYKGKAGTAADGAKAGSEHRKKRSSAFNVGPAHAPKNAYLGKAKKIKADLIMKSKIKREYAKVLKAEGMESDRLKPRGRKGESQSTADPPKNPPVLPSQSPPLLPGSSPTLDEAAFPAPGRPSQRQRATQKPLADKTRALRPQDIGHPMPQTSLRELKKEAYSKFHRPANRSGATPTGAGVMGHGRRGGSQPNLGARMGVLLEKIKRDKAAAN